MQYSQVFLEVLTNASGWPSAYRTRAPPPEGWKWATSHSVREELTLWIYPRSWYSASFPSFLSASSLLEGIFTFSPLLKGWHMVFFVTPCLAVAGPPISLHPQLEHLRPCRHGPSWYDRDNSGSLTYSLGPRWHHCPEYLNWILYPKPQVASASTFSLVSSLSLYSDLRTHSWVCHLLVTSLFLSLSLFLDFYSIPDGKFSPQCPSLLLASLFTISSPQNRCWFILPAACQNLPWPWKLGTISSLVLKDSPGKVTPLGVGASTRHSGFLSFRWKLCLILLSLKSCLGASGKGGGLGF